MSEKLREEIANALSVPMYVNDYGEWVLPKDKSLDDLADAILPLISQDEWRPIETAPKGRKAVQLYVPENKCIYTAIWVEQRSWWEIFGGDWREHLQRASHWRPLPTPPGQEG